jgi:hypothetical protein
VGRAPFGEGFGRGGTVAMCGKCGTVVKSTLCRNTSCTKESVRPLVAKLVAILVAKPSGHTPLLIVIPHLCARF